MPKQKLVFSAGKSTTAGYMSTTGDIQIHAVNRPDIEGQNRLFQFVCGTRNSVSIRCRSGLERAETPARVSEAMTTVHTVQIRSVAHGTEALYR